ncbi:amidohydrolase family protein [Paracoccus sp. 11-3]|uniref:Amidohydrolase family protein n=1 Tax=Paracoccus amoyensis TaxID=2760093 RepID=A0A926GE56_9RHOB|nr:amidohydrolase family protein [Paracoccus amoyensis]MBC9246871.1 amidohydrolase family protein [Paracoccus amoyensis]
MQMIDAHCHFWQLGRGDYAWLDRGGYPLQPIRRDFVLSDYPSEARKIVVQAAPTVAETDYLLSLAAVDSQIVGIVGWIDLSAANAVEQIHARAELPVFKGVRPVLQDIPQTDWLECHARADALNALIRSGLRFDALVTARHLPMLARFAKRHEDLPLIIDHAAKPQPGARQDWHQGMQELAAIPHVHCKFSGLLTELSPDELRDPLPALRAIIDRLLEWFGADRLIWGSDWPVLTLAASYEQWLDLTTQLLEELTEDERDAILRGNAAQFYGVKP